MPATFGSFSELVASCCTHDAQTQHVTANNKAADDCDGFATQRDGMSSRHGGMYVEGSDCGRKEGRSERILTQQSNREFSTSARTVLLMLNVFCDFSHTLRPFSL